MGYLTTFSLPKKPTHLLFSLSETFPCAMQKPAKNSISECSAADSPRRWKRRKSNGSRQFRNAEMSIFFCLFPRHSFSDLAESTSLQNQGCGLAMWRTGPCLAERTDPSSCLPSTPLLFSVVSHFKCQPLLWKHVVKARRGGQSGVLLPARER